MHDRQLPAVGPVGWNLNLGATAFHLLQVQP